MENRDFQGLDEVLALIPFSCVEPLCPNFTLLRNTFLNSAETKKQQLILTLEMKE